jgi:MIP family channel proteins
MIRTPWGFRPRHAQNGRVQSGRVQSLDMRNLLLASCGELVGTFLLVLVGTAVATAAFLHTNTAGPAYDSLSIALSFGLILIPIVVALGNVSGAHVNPAVTLGLAIARKFPWNCVPAYWLAQMLGAVIASFTVWALYGKRAYDEAALGAPAPVHDASNLQVFTIEGLIAYILVFTVITVASDKLVLRNAGPLAIGLALSAGVLLGGPVSGGAGNPARALGPMLVAHSFTSWFVYLIGPFAGAALAACTHELLSSARPPSP